jgi:hypothetical protein
LLRVDAGPKEIEFLSEQLRAIELDRLLVALQQLSGHMQSGRFASELGQETVSLPEVRVLTTGLVHDVQRIHHLRQLRRQIATATATATAALLRGRVLWRSARHFSRSAAFGERQKSNERKANSGLIRPRQPVWSGEKEEGSASPFIGSG